MQLVYCSVFLTVSLSTRVPGIWIASYSESLPIDALFKVYGRVIDDPKHCDDC